MRSFYKSVTAVCSVYESVSVVYLYESVTAVCSFYEGVTVVCSFYETVAAACSFYESVTAVRSFSLNKMYSFIVIISSTNKYRKHKSSMLIWVLRSFYENVTTVCSLGCSRFSFRLGALLKWTPITSRLVVQSLSPNFVQQSSFTSLTLENVFRNSSFHNVFSQNVGQYYF